MAQPAAKVGVSTVAGGVIIGPGATTVLVEGAPQAVVGDSVAPHAPFTGDHNSATIVSGNPDITAEGRAVARLGDMCSCGHTIDGDCATTVMK